MSTEPYVFTLEEVQTFAWLHAAYVWGLLEQLVITNFPDTLADVENRQRQLQTAAALTPEFKKAFIDLAVGTLPTMRMKDTDQATIPPRAELVELLDRVLDGKGDDWVSITCQDKASIRAIEQAVGARLLVEDDECTIKLSLLRSASFLNAISEPTRD